VITEPVRAATTAADDWVPTLDGDGILRDGADRRVDYLA
jgi:hypothetical protein